MPRKPGVGWNTGVGKRKKRKPGVGWNTRSKGKKKSQRPRVRKKKTRSGGR